MGNGMGFSAAGLVRVWWKGEGARVGYIRNCCAKHSTTSPIIFTNLIWGFQADVLMVESTGSKILVTQVLVNFMKF